MPEDLVSDEILVNIGSPWVPVSDMQDFVNHLVGRDGQKDRETVKFLQNAGKWEISEYLNSPRYKANGIEFGKLLEDIFNNKSIAIYDRVEDKPVLNVEKRMPPTLLLTIFAVSLRNGCGVTRNVKNVLCVITTITSITP